MLYCHFFRRQAEARGAEAPNPDNDAPPDDFREIQIIPQHADMQVTTT